MGDRYTGMIECPECKKQTEFLYAEEWGEIQICDHCRKRFKMYLTLTAKKINEK